VPGRGRIFRHFQNGGKSSAPQFTDIQIKSSCVNHRMNLLEGWIDLLYLNRSHQIGSLMAVQINDKKVFSLSEVAESIQKTLADRYGSSFWIKAEMIKLHYYPHSGHCYREFVEKNNGKVVAQLKANLWQEDYRRINARFEEVLKEPLKDGINILFCARITFDALHGLSLRILDIDPSFSLGELERLKLETIQKLKDEG